MPPSWYALAVHPRRERAAAEDLGRRGFEVFMPTAVKRKAWSDRIKRVESPLFPGYLFVNTSIDAATRRELLRATATYDLVGRIPGDARLARPVAAVEIKSLQVLVENERVLDPVARLLPGQPVEVGAGPLRGVRGVVEVAADGQRRLVVQLQLLGRGVRTLLEADNVLLASGSNQPGAAANAA